MELAHAFEEASRDIRIAKLKPKQREAVEAFVSRKDLFVSPPTGYGKFTIFTILPILYGLGAMVFVRLHDIIPQGVFDSNCKGFQSGEEKTISLEDPVTIGIFCGAKAEYRI